MALSAKGKTRIAPSKNNRPVMTNRSCLPDHSERTIAARNPVRCQRRGLPQSSNPPRPADGDRQRSKPAEALPDHDPHPERSCPAGHVLARKHRSRRQRSR